MSVVNAISFIKFCKNISGTSRSFHVVLVRDTLQFIAFVVYTEYISVHKYVSVLLWIHNF